MSQTAGMKFSCDACGKRFTWKPEIAGKKAKCSCGNAITVPMTMTAAEPEETYDIAQEPVKPVVRPKQTAVAAPATPASAAVASALPRLGVPASGRAAPARVSAGGRPLDYKAGPTHRQRDRAENLFFNQTKDVFVPLAMLMFGLAGMVLKAMFSDGFPLMGALVLVLISMTLEIVVLVGAAFAVASWAGVSFGTLWIGLLKLATLVVFCAGLDTLVQWPLRGTGIDWLAGWCVFTISYLGLLMWLFDMDFGEALWVWMVVGTIRFLISLFLTVALVAWLAGSFGATGVPRGGPKIITASAATQVKQVLDLQEQGLLLEARKFIAEGRQAALKSSVDALYAAGAKNVWFIPLIQPNTGKIDGTSDIVIELPTDTAARKRCFQIMNDYFDSLAATPGEAPSTAPTQADDDEDEGRLKDVGDPYLFIGI